MTLLEDTATAWAKPWRYRRSTIRGLWSLGRPRGLEEGVKVVNYLCPNWKCVEKGATADKRHCVLLLLPGWARGRESGFDAIGVLAVHVTVMECYGLDHG